MAEPRKVSVHHAEIIFLMIVGYLVFAFGMVIVQLAHDMLSENKEAKRE